MSDIEQSVFDPTRTEFPSIPETPFIKRKIESIYPQSQETKQPSLETNQQVDDSTALIKFIRTIATTDPQFIEDIKGMSDAEILDHARKIGASIQNQSEEIFREASLESERREQVRLANQEEPKKTNFIDKIRSRFSPKAA